VTSAQQFLFVWARRCGGRSNNSMNCPNCQRRLVFWLSALTAGTLAGHSAHIAAVTNRFSLVATSSKHSGFMNVGR
jgi:hypothetical protein